MRNGVPGLLSDEALVAAAQAGDGSAFAVLVRRHTRLVHRTASRLVPQRSGVEDVVQEVWLNVWVHLAGFSGRSAFTTWLYRVTVNTAVNAGRGPAGRVVVPVDPGELALPPGAGADQAVVGNERVRAVRAAVAALPAGQRAAVVLRDLEGLSYEQTANVLQMNVPGVKSALHRGRTALARTLEEWR